MEWIQGETLYAWAARRNPSSYQVMRLLAQGAWALQAVHNLGVVHRDVKGENMLVRPANGRLFLMDFGVGHYPGAERLTPTPVPPGTPAYNSPRSGTMRGATASSLMPCISLGDSAVTSVKSSEKAPSEKVVATEVPPQPLPGQLKPDVHGRCRKGQSAINGGCWLKASVDLEDCAGNGYVYKGSCYVPMFPPGREPTSAPMK